MIYTKQEIGNQLKNELNTGFDVHRISNWAHELFFNSRGDYSNEINDILQNILLMEAGPEFEYTDWTLAIRKKI